MRLLFVLNDPPYGTERSYNGVRHALEVGKREGVEVKMFLIADAVACAVAGQKTPDGYYNLERMLSGVARRGGEIGCCGTCMDARGIDAAELIPQAHRSTMAELGDWTEWADKVVTY